MTEKRSKSLIIWTAAGALFLVILLGVFISGKKTAEAPTPGTGNPVAMKIPKAAPAVETSEQEVSTDVSTPDMTWEQGMDEEAAVPGETLPGVEQPSIVEEGEGEPLVFDEETPEQGDVPVPEGEEDEELISSPETSEGEEPAAPAAVSETDGISGMEAESDAAEQGAEEETVQAVPETPEIESPENSTPEPETEAAPVDKKTPVAASAGKQVLRDIFLSRSGPEQKLVFQTESPVTRYKYFILSNPPRLVVDLPGSWKAPGFSEKKVDSSLISRIRLWNHGDKLRIVSDLTSDKTLLPVLTTVSEGVEIALKTR